jgi:hypothetical protein
VPLYTFVDNAVPTSSEWNSNVRDQVVTQCTSATRPASPVEGQCIFETDTGRLLYYSGAAWVIITEPRQTWTPTITQSGTVAGTVNRGWYRRENGLFEARLKWTATAAGTASNAIVVTLPVTMLDTNDVSSDFQYFDTGAGTPNYVGRCSPTSTSTVQLVTDASTGAFGVNPAITIASGDQIFLGIRGTY